MHKSLLSSATKHWTDLWFGFCFRSTASSYSDAAICKCLVCRGRRYRPPRMPCAREAGGGSQRPNCWTCDLHRHCCVGYSIAVRAMTATFSLMNARHPPLTVRLPMQRKAFAPCQRPRAARPCRTSKEYETKLRPAYSDTTAVPETTRPDFSR